MLGTFPFSTTSYSSSETPKLNEEIISFTLNIQNQYSIVLNVDPQKGLILDLKS